MAGKVDASERLLVQAFKLFRENPSAAAWQALTKAMLAFQQKETDLTDVHRALRTVRVARGLE